MRRSTRSRRSSWPRRWSSGRCRRRGGGGRWPRKGGGAGEPPPAEVEPLLGIWFMEGSQLVFRWRDGQLQAKFADSPDFMPPAVFERESETRWRIVSGWEHGELLRIEEGRMVLSGYPVTREPGVWV